MTAQYGGVNSLLLGAAALFAVTILIVIVFFIVKRLSTFSTVFPVSKPNAAASTLPGIRSQSVNYKTDSNVELKKAVSKNLNVNGLEKDSGLI
ncbi:hypothetical protein Tcan_18375 [Toxocara canis]|uniref:Uncharacterized protein n=1 Tax=Toxocara canis TaxID=6265 RepID=A0A0B2VAA1_TOXCA|nr:hypothetical protein Tcan_18375 [Toxocara canis]